MDKTKENPNASIEMTFGTALAITQQTYHYFELKESKNREAFYNELNSTLEQHENIHLTIKEFNKFKESANNINKQNEIYIQETIKHISQSLNKLTEHNQKQIDKLTEKYIKEENKYIKEANEEIKHFRLYNVDYDEASNFSGMTYIYDDENTVNVAIACRGSVKFSLHTKEGKKDWLYNNFSMLWKSNTDSDNFAKNYAINIATQIQQQYSDKQINVITLGHSKGGREAQKQMLALLSKYKDDNKVNVCCLTFNSAPIVFYEFYQIGKHKDYCQNLYLTDELKIFKDILKLFNYFKYGNNCAYPLKGKFVGIIIFLSLLLVGPALYTIYPTLESEMPLLAFPTTLGIIIIILFFVLSFTKSLFIIVTCVLVLTFLLDSLQPLICINLVITAILVMVLSHYTHGINIFKDEKSSYEKLKDKNIREIICAKDLDKLANLKFRYISKSTQKLINGVPKFPYASRIYPKH